jgi:hypothetical protein
MHVLDGLAESKTIAGDDGGGVYAVLHKLVSSPKEFCGDDDNGCRAISNLLVLLVCQVHQDLPRWVLDI